ncbi:MAG: gephyrin-like molybdotransferase Glp [Burkholderiaceae bacterium]
MSELGPSPLMAGDPQLSVEQARAAIHAALRPIDGLETVPLAAAVGRVLAADLICPIDVPPHDNSAMDGYAFDGTALRDGQALALQVAGTVFAGAPPTQAVRPGSCVRIMTGAVMPAGADTVVPQELVEPTGESVRIAAGVIRRGENRRKRGEDLARGSAALAAGRVLRPADVGLAASLGFTELGVRRRLKVALFSTGNEVVAPGDALPAGAIYDSNRFALAAALQRLGMEVIDLGLVRDDPAALQATLERALREADAVLTSGGVSVGEADYTRDILARMGEVAFWKVAMRPGRPFAFGPLRRGGTGVAASATAHPAWLFALPGNPVAALVTFYVFAREALLMLAGARPEAPVTLSARCTGAVRKRPGRTEFQRGIVRRGADGAWEVALVGAQGAGILRSLSEANALVVIGHEQGPVAAGEPVTVWLFDGLV